MKILRIDLDFTDLSLSVISDDSGLACCLLQKFHPITDGLLDILLSQLNVTLQCLKGKYHFTKSSCEGKIMQCAVIDARHKHRPTET